MKDYDEGWEGEQCLDQDWLVVDCTAVFSTNISIGASSSVLQHFFSNATFRLFSFTWAGSGGQSVVPAWWHRNLHQLSLVWKPVSSAPAPVVTVLLHILYNTSHQPPARHSTLITISYKYSNFSRLYLYLKTKFLISNSGKSVLSPLSIWSLAGLV